MYVYMHVCIRVYFACAYTCILCVHAYMYSVCWQNTVNERCNVCMYVCMYVCVCVCVYIYIYAYIQTSMHICIDLPTRTCKNAHTLTCMHIARIHTSPTSGNHTYTHTYTNACMHACTQRLQVGNHTYTHTYMHACMHICMHAYIHA
jgi:hypothetical protein